jgi:acyl-CoA thioesterase I
MKFFYNINTFILKVFLVTAGILPLISTAATLTVPDIGSVWVSSLEYKNLSSSKESGDPAPVVKRAPETMTVVRHESGIPVFASEVFGYKGEIIETAAGTIVYTENCKDSVPKEVFTAPVSPNQCGWHLCSAPVIGKTFIRPMIIFSEMYSCTPKVGIYSFTSNLKTKLDGESVTVGDVKVDFGLFQKTTWKSYVADGKGEIYATSSARETTYSKVQVSLIPYVNVDTKLVSETLVKFAKVEEKTQCDIVAFGDSLTQGMGTSQNQSYPAMLSEMVGKEICNLGISGNTTDDAKGRLSQVISLKPKVVFVALGANDLLKGVNESDTKSNLNDMLEKLTKEGIMVVLLGFEGLTTFEKHAKVIATLPALQGNQEGIIYVPNAFKGVLDDVKMLSADNMHPNPDGYKKVAQNIYDEAFGALETLSGFAIKH